MNLRLVLPLVTFLATPALFAQGGTTTPEPVRVEERVVGDETITVEPMRADEPVHDVNVVFTVVEEMPEFPGGQEALMKYLSSRIEYPEEAMQENIEGIVFISFIVEQDGRISNVKSLRGLGGGLTEEAIRVVKGMPNWLPGKQRGAPVRVQYNLPIRFKL
ncbi:MAG: energy transducer TonB [Flavobacteriales bacterium]|nr:energy transducer TonB [Flavobacteriales bacterium]